MSEKVSIHNLGFGTVVELFDSEMTKVLENCLDFNTSARTKRKITLTMTITPDEDREVCDVEAAVELKLAARQPYPTQFLLGRDEDGVLATEYNPKQKRLFDSLEAQRKAIREGTIIPFNATNHKEGDS
jgi:hypothetical protein